MNGMNTKRYKYDPVTLIITASEPLANLVIKLARG